jgi:hypothetical protein
LEWLLEAKDKSRSGLILSLDIEWPLAAKDKSRSGLILSLGIEYRLRCVRLRGTNAVHNFGGAVGPIVSC